MAKKTLSDQEIKAQIIAKQQQNSTGETKFPTEIVPLPSKGLVYPKDHSLSSGTVEIKYMTAKDEDILTNNNLLKSGRALDVLYKSLLVGNGEGQAVDIDDMISGDKSAVMLATRLLGYGSEYNITLKDDRGEDFPHTVDLNELTVKDVDYTLYKNDRYLEFELPISKITVKFKLRTSKEDESLAKENVRLQKAGKNASTTTSLKHSIVEVDGNDDKEFVHKFIDNELLAKDSLSLRRYMVEVTPDYNLAVYIDRPDKGVEAELPLPIDTSFFWPRL